MKMPSINKDKWASFKKWIVIQKVTLGRGYGWLNVPMIGFIAAGQLKLLFPAFFEGIGRFIVTVLFCTLGLWLVGYIDKKMELLHAEQAYGTETNPMMMRVVKNTEKEIK